MRCLFFDPNFQELLMASLLSLWLQWLQWILSQFLFIHHSPCSNATLNLVPGLKLKGWGNAYGPTYILRVHTCHCTSVTITPTVLSSAILEQDVQVSKKFGAKGLPEAGGWRFCGPSWKVPPSQSIPVVDFEIGNINLQERVACIYIYTTKFGWLCLPDIAGFNLHYVTD